MAVVLLLSECRIAASLQEIQYISAFIPEFIVDSMIGQVTEITVFSYQSFIHAKYCPDFLVVIKHIRHNPVLDNGDVCCNFCCRWLHSFNQLCQANLQDYFDTATLKIAE